MAEGVTGFLFLFDTGMVDLNSPTPAVEATLDKYFSVLMCPDTRPATSEETARFDTELWLCCVELLCFLPS